jgi:hypothetical protein
MNANTSHNAALTGLLTDIIITDDSTAIPAST